MTEYIFRGVNLRKIRNKNELRVNNRLETVLSEIDTVVDDYLDIEDIYALTLNRLPARYVQPTGMTLREPLTDEEIDSAIQAAIIRVMNSPKHV